MFNLKIFFLLLILFILTKSSLNKVKIKSLTELKNDKIIKGSQIGNICDVELIDIKLRNTSYLVKNVDESSEYIRKSIAVCSNSGLDIKIKNEYCNFMKEEDHPNEIFYQQGSKIGLNEVNFKEEIGQIILKDHKLISNGANEMRKQLIELSFNGQSIKDLLISKSNKELFSNTSGFVLSNVRYVRAYYCVQKMAKLLENVYQSNYSKYAKVLYAINGVWIGNQQIVNKMENVVRLTNNLAEIVNNTGKNSKLPNLTKARKEISEAIKNVAISENALTINERKGSTMALVGYFAVNKNPMNSEFNKCNKHKYNCIVYFHIKSNNDLSFEEFFDIDMI